MTHTIALVDDDQNILTSVSIALESEGFVVKPYKDGEEAVKDLLKNPADLVVLDVKMPRMDGIEVIKHLKEKTEMPVIFLTSKDDEIDELLGLRMGAEDYITKPFSQRLLLERIRVILRRQDMIKNAGALPGESLPSDHTEILIRGSLTLDDARHICSWKGEPVDLTVTEYLLVKSLAQNPGHVKSRDQLMNFAYGESIYVDDRTIDSHIKRVRKKFKQINDDFNQIETVYGVGYRYKDDTTRS
ncbi:MAG: response regulator transcription factor [Pseudomonadota bacterium]